MSTEATRDVPLLSELVAEEIRSWMGRRRVSGASIARQLGVSTAWVSYRLTGAQPIDLNDLQKIAAVLGVEVIDLLPPRREGRFITAVGSTRETDETVKSHKPRGPERSPLTSHPHHAQPRLSTRRPGRILHGASA